MIMDSPISMAPKDTSKSEVHEDHAHHPDAFDSRKDPVSTIEADNPGDEA
jgi:hypothetical protein